MVGTHNAQHTHTHAHVNEQERMKAFLTTKLNSSDWRRSAVLHVRFILASVASMQPTQDACPMAEQAWHNAAVGPAGEGDDGAGTVFGADAAADGG
jgi:hypothetical protein